MRKNGANSLEVIEIVSGLQFRFTTRDTWLIRKTLDTRGIILRAIIDGYNAVHHWQLPRREGTGERVKYNTDTSLATLVKIL